MNAIDTLVDIDSDYNSDEIHIDVTSNEFGDTPVKQVLWGEYNRKPVAQELWDLQVAAAASEAASDFRPKIKDFISGKLILIDTGAAKSVWPRTDYPGAIKDTHKALKAVNGTFLPTYGTVHRDIKLCKKTFSHPVLLADVQSPILGWDFLLHFKFDLLWQNNKCTLFNSRTKASYPLQFSQTPTDLLNLAPVNISYKQWSQSQKTPPSPEVVPAKYMSLINKYKGILVEATIDNNPKHGVIHNIDTGDNVPCRARPRPAGYPPLQPSPAP